jgi:hypothetical protein
MGEKLGSSQPEALAEAPPQGEAAMKAGTLQHLPDTVRQLFGPPGHERDSHR